MLKAKALCAVDGNTAPEIRSLMSVVEKPIVVEKVKRFRIDGFDRQYAEYRD